MRTSSFYLRCAYAMWAIGVIWSLLSVIFYNRFNEFRNAVGFCYPFIAAGILFGGIQFAKKGVKLKYIEEGKLSEYLKAVNRKPKVWPFMAAIYVVIAIILIVINLVKR